LPSQRVSLFGSFQTSQKNTHRDKIPKPKEKMESLVILEDDAFFDKTHSYAFMIDLFIRIL